MSNQFMTDIKDLDIARKNYSKEWEATSNFFRTKGYYEWCANNITPYSNILEIGIGIGINTVSLCKNNCKIISIEENIYNINKAIELLKIENIKYAKIEREKETVFDGEQYNITYHELGDISASDVNKYDVVILQGDLILDEPLKNWLCSYGKFDAIVCWFTGIHRIVYSNINYSFEHPSEYRAKLHEIIFKLGEQLLNQNGMINFCDRATIPKGKLPDSILNNLFSESELAESNLFIKSTNSLVVETFDTTNGIQHESSLTVNDNTKILFSISLGKQ